MERKALEEARDELLADPDPLFGRAGPTPSIIVAWSGSGLPVSRDSRR